MAKTHAAPVNPGEALYRYLQKEWAELGTTRGAWCRQADLPDSTVHRWGTGKVEPDMKSLRTVARTLGRPVSVVLLAAGYLTEDELTVTDGDMSERQPATLEQALTQDPELVSNPALVGAIRNLVTAIRDAQDGKTVAAKRITVARTPTSRRAPRKPAGGAAAATS